METQNETSYLKQVSLFADLADEDIRALMTVARKRTFRSGEVIFHREDSDQSYQSRWAGDFTGCFWQGRMLRRICYS